MSNSLLEYSEMLAKYHDSKIAAEQALADKLKAEMPKKVAELKSYPNQLLFTVYDGCLSGAYSSLVVMEVLYEYREAVKKEILSRMEGSPNAQA